MGLHSGAAQLRDGDYYGSVTNRAARLMSVAHGGQVVVSHTTAELAGDALVDVTFLDLGEHRLRDLERPEHVLQVCHEDLEHDFAPLRSLDAFPSNLPLQTTGFVGRERELADVASALADARVVTLTGVGGVGKTRLATQVAADVLPHYRDGAWLCELAPVGEPEAIVEALATTLGVQPRWVRRSTTPCSTSCARRSSCSSSTTASTCSTRWRGLVDRIVHTAARVTVLATSREGLARARENAWSRCRRSGIDRRRGHAVRRARRRRASRRSRSPPRTRPRSSRSAARLDGIPLAIELAAARVQAMTPAEIAARLDDQFRLLSSGRRTAVERHQTLRRAIDWSYDLLSDDERRVLQRLSVFAGGCTLDAAEAVARRRRHRRARRARPPRHPRPSVARRRRPDRRARRATGCSRRSGSTRRTASKKPGETDAVGQRHAAFFTALAEEAGPHLRAADQLAWIARLAPEFDNLRVALAWALDHDDLDLALTLVVAVCVNGIDIGYLALTWAELVAGAPGVDEHPLGPACSRRRRGAQCSWGGSTTPRGTRRGGWRPRLPSRLPPNPANFQAPATIALFSGDPAAAQEHARQWIACCARGRRRLRDCPRPHHAQRRADRGHAGGAAHDRGSRRRSAPARQSVESLVGAHHVRAVPQRPQRVDAERAVAVFEEAVAVGTGCREPAGRRVGARGPRLGARSTRRLPRSTPRHDRGRRTTASDG